MNFTNGNKAEDARFWGLDIGTSLELGIWGLELSAVIAFPN
jgi:hypothetical protein